MTPHLWFGSSVIDVGGGGFPGEKSRDAVPLTFAALTMGTNSEVPLADLQLRADQLFFLAFSQADNSLTILLSLYPKSLYRSQWETTHVTTFQNIVKQILLLQGSLMMGAEGTA